ncbi:MAG: fumarylacetoacetate hydrolase family protein [Deltaproteobacteria bacterium]|nr:fumarylacetoacetate hydrolase family protein [Candidatus Anaeroferrophillacea bacterium]
MRYARFYDGAHGARLARLVNERLVPLDFAGDLLDLMAGTRMPPPDGRELDPATVTWAPPVGRPGKIIAIGLNYRDHVTESKGGIPERPLVFAKFPSSLCGHRQPVCWDPALTTKVDFEAELAVVIGRRVRSCAPAAALETVFGYTCANDVSARDLQFGDGQWVRGKSLDTFCPLGPWLVTADEVAEVQDLAITCRINGELMQESTTANMIFPVAELIAFLSRNFTLFPGDVILTGTPSGVGAFREPSIYLRDGDHMEVAIAGIGGLENTCRMTPCP